MLKNIKLITAFGFTSMLLTVRFAVNVWGLSPQGSNEKLAMAGIQALADFIKNAGLPTTMRELGVKTKDELQKIAQSIQTGPGSYHKCLVADVMKIFEECW